MTQVSSEKEKTASNGCRGGTAGTNDKEIPKGKEITRDPELDTRTGDSCQANWGPFKKYVTSLGGRGVK